MHRKSWLALGYTVPVSPSKARVYIWRKLKECGAEYFKQGVAVLPNFSQSMQQFSMLAQKIRQMGGEASIVELRFIDPVDEAQMTARFRKQVENEYQELLDDCANALHELRLAGKRLTEPQAERMKQMVKRYCKTRSKDYFQETDTNEIEAGLNEMIYCVKGFADDLGKQLRSLMEK